MNDLFIMATRASLIEWLVYYGNYLVFHIAHMKATSFLLYYYFHVLVHLNLKLSGKSSFQLFYIIVVLSMEFLNIVMKDSRDSPPFHEYTLGLISKAPPPCHIIPRNTPFLDLWWFSTTLTYATTSLMQPKFLLAIIHMLLNGVKVLNYAPTKCKFTFIGVFNCCATNLAFRTKGGASLALYKELIIAFPLPCSSHLASFVSFPDF